MLCMNEFCIYQKDRKCLLETIEIDFIGMCDSCIYPDIPPKILEAEKEKLRNRYEAEDSGLN